MAAFLALGSNVGDRLYFLQKARDQLRDLAVPHTFCQSALYQTAPIDCGDGVMDFLNAVVSFEFNGSAQQLLGIIQQWEMDLGRSRLGVNSPRTIDIDILLFDEQIVAEENLLIPHPRMHLRRFVLEPMCDIAPDLRIPGHSTTLVELLPPLKLSQSLDLLAAQW